MNKKVVLGTHMRGGSASAADGDRLNLEAECDVIHQIAKRARLKDYTILIMKQPREKYTADEQDKDRTEWQRAAQTLGPPLELIYDDHYVPLEPTTLAWNKLYRYAFGHMDAHCVVYLDLMLPLWDHVRRARAIDALGDLVILSLKNDYVIGDYVPVLPSDALPSDDRKEDVDLKIAIEERVKQMLSNRFPVLLDGWPLFEQLKRPRSEFHAVGRRLYEALQDLAPVPYDYGLQMLVVAKAERLNVCRAEIGPVPEFGHYTQAKMAWQLRRVDFQLAQLQEWWAKIVTSHKQSKIC